MNDKWSVVKPFFNNLSVKLYDTFFLRAARALLAAEPFFPEPPPLPLPPEPGA